MSTVTDLKSTCLRYFTKMDNSDMCKWHDIEEETGRSDLTVHTRTRENSTPMSKQGTWDSMHALQKIGEYLRLD